MYILDVLTEILASEQSPALLTKLCSLWGHVITALVPAGKWAVLETVLSNLHETEGVRPDIAEEHRQHLATLLTGLGKPEHIKSIESYLNRTPSANTEGLSTVLLMMGPDAVSLLCSLLANLENSTHQAIVSETLHTLAKDHADPLIRGLADRRPAYVRNLLAIVAKWNNPGPHVPRQGWGMLVEQAAVAFELWRGVRPDTRPVLEALKLRAAAGPGTRP